nr:MAG TPA: hypothetical protein [Herelleviridae sp.]
MIKMSYFKFLSPLYNILYYIYLITRYRYIDI